MEDKMQLSTILASLCQPGDRIGVDHHTYPGLKTVAAMLSIQLVPIKSKNYEMSPTALNMHVKMTILKAFADTRLS